MFERQIILVRRKLNFRLIDLAEFAAVSPDT
jgi:hypothetical protein